MFLTIDSKLDTFKKRKINNQPVSDKDNPLVFAFWTCLQLERYGHFPSVTTRLTLNSDIFAELPCPLSGILTFEVDMPGPNLEAARKAGFSPIVVESYAAQLFLRKHLNDLHSMFYNPDNQSKKSHF